MDIINIEKPELNRKRPEENLAILDKWLGETTEKLNFWIMQVTRELNNGNNRQD